MVFGFWEALVILAIVVVIFGAGKLPTVMGDLAKGIKTFKAGLAEDREPSPEPPAPPRELPAASSAAGPAAADPDRKA